MTAAFHRFIIVNSEGFKWFEATASGGQGSQRGAVAWADVRGAARVGQWNGCAAAAAARGCERVTLAARLLGVEMQHPGVEKDVTVLWCKNEVERDVGAAAARPRVRPTSRRCCRRWWPPSTACAGATRRQAGACGANRHRCKLPPACSMHNRVEQLGLQQHSAAFMQHAARLLLRCNRDAPPGETRFGTTLCPARRRRL